MKGPEGGRPGGNARVRWPVTFADALDRTVVGVVGAAAQGLFVRGDSVSVTVSAATALSDEDGDALAARLWDDASAAIGLMGGWSDAPPPFSKVKSRIVKEKRATFLQTPEALEIRPPTRGPIANLFLAGDWTDTGLPATIEGAIRSGDAAADAIMAGS